MEYGYGTPAVELNVEAQGLTAIDARRDRHTYEVRRPMAIGRQRDQLIKMVMKTHPEAQIASVEDGIAVFYSRTHMVVAWYDDASKARVDAEFAGAESAYRV